MPDDAILGGRFLTERELASAGFRKLGKNVRIHSRASIYGVENISLGDNVRIDDFAVLIATRAPMSIGSFVHIAPFCYLGGRAGIVLEDFCGLSPGVQLYSASDDYSGAKLTNPTVPPELTGGKQAPVALRKHVIIGASSVVLPGCTIGEGSSVGAQSLVTKSLEPWGMYSGVPVHRLKERKKDLLELEKVLVERFDAR